MASLKDIASALNVSVSLVSKVLNKRMGNTGVTEQLAESIRNKAQEMNYQKNATALSLRKGCHDTVGVFFHNDGESGSALFERFMLGVAGEARRHNKKLMLSFFEKGEEFSELKETAHRGMIDGLIIGGVQHDEMAEMIYQVGKNGLPIITVQREALHPEIPNIGMDQEKICYLSTRHLIEQGCRRIGHINSRESRYAGYKKAMAEAGLGIDPDWVIEEPETYSVECGEAFTRRALEKRLFLDGIVMQSDQQAVGALNVLRSAGISCPDDVKLIGVDNAPFCKFQSVPISSVSQQPTEKGKAAVNLLLDLCAGNDVQGIDIEPELKIRRSSGG